MILVLIIIGIAVFYVSTYSPPVVVDNSDLGINSPIVNKTEPANVVTPVLRDTLTPVEKAPEPIIQPATNGEVLLTRPSLDERPVSTSPIVPSGIKSLVETGKLVYDDKLKIWVPQLSVHYEPTGGTSKILNIWE